MRPAEIERILEDAEPYVFFLPASINPDVQGDAKLGLPDFIAVKTGETGYWPVYTTAKLENLNEGAPQDVLEAAYMGSLFGWHCPGAQPAIEWILQQREKANG